MKKIVQALRPYLQRVRQESRKSPLVSVGLLAIALILILLLARQWLGSSLSSLSLEAKALEKEIAYRTSLLSQKDRLAKDLANLETNWKFLEQKFLSAGSNDLAFFDIQKIFDGLAANRKVSVKSYRFNDVKRSGDLYILPVSIELTGSYLDFVSILSAMEIQPKYLRVSDLEIFSTADTESLIVRLVVEGYRYEKKEN
jgi:Tfp pilus assembly protein PilO